MFEPRTTTAKIRFPVEFLAVVDIRPVGRISP